MDKKGTKIAYFVACAVFVVLLVVLCTLHCARGFCVAANG